MVGCSAANRPTCVLPLLPSRQCGRTFGTTVGHGWVSSCKIDRRVSFLYFRVDDVEGPLVLQEFFLQKLGLQAKKPCTRTQMKHARFGLADICSSDRCEIQWMSLSEGSESLSTSLTCSFILQVVESSMKIVCEKIEDTTSSSKINDLGFSFQ